jgi:hypothetical protein
VAVVAGIALGLVLLAYVSGSGEAAQRPAASDGILSSPWALPFPTGPLSAGMPPTPSASPVRSAPSVAAPASSKRATGTYGRSTTRPHSVATSPSPMPDPNPPNGFVSIVDPIDKCVDVVAFGTSDGDFVQQWSCNGGDNQLWAFAPSDAGHYLIVNRNSRKCLDVYGFDRSDGARVQQWSCNGGPNQQWHLDPGVDGYYRLVNRNSDKCLDVNGLDRSDGARVQQWSCNGGANQQFTFRWSRWSGRAGRYGR